MGPRSKEDKSEKVDSPPFLVGPDRKTKWVFAHMVPKKGHNSHAARIVGREIRLAGYSKTALKSDQEPGIKTLLGAAEREKGEAIEFEKEKSLQ